MSIARHNRNPKAPLSPSFQMESTLNQRQQCLGAVGRSCVDIEFRRGARRHGFDLVEQLLNFCKGHVPTADYMGRHNCQFIFDNVGDTTFDEDRANPGQCHIVESHDARCQLAEQRRVTWQDTEPTIMARKDCVEHVRVDLKALRRDYRTMQL